MVRRHLMQNIFTMEAVQECKRRHREAKRLPWDGAMISECHLGKVGADQGNPRRSESHSSHSPILPSRLACVIQQQKEYRMTQTHDL